MTARILIVDDLLPNIRLLEAKLESEYYDVESAQSGVEAIEKATTNPPDIILLDIMMPGMDGFETCRILKADPKTMDIPVVMVTALSDVNDRVQGLNAGADDFITKPINDMALFARIRSLVRLKSMTDELKLRDRTGSKLGINEEIRKTINNVKNAKILVVDDDIGQARQIASKLESLGMVCHLESIPKEAVKKSESTDYDLIIVSTQLNNDSGLHLCTHLRSQEKTRATPLLIIIEDSDLDVLVKGLDLGINDYIITPIDGNEVVARAKIQVRRKRYQDALKESQRENLTMAIIDKLTGVYNRHYFDLHIQSTLNSAIELNKPLSLMILDIDFFKKINDDYGHLSGDEILKQLPKILLNTLRPSDSIARFGGEEFVVLLPDTSVSNAAKVAERVRLLIQNFKFAITVEPKTVSMTVSIGVSVSNISDTVNSLIERADKALYHVKNTGRNKVAVYYDKNKR